MINVQDIGTEGLKAGAVTFVGADKVKRGDYYENTYEFMIDCDRVDVTTFMDTERKHMRVLTGNQGTM